MWGATEIVLVLSILTVLAMLVVLRGLWPWATDKTGTATFHFCIGVAILAAAVVLRVGYWDVLPYGINMVWPNAWAWWGEYTGWTKINVVWHLVLFVATYHLLRAMQLLIPEHERSEWPLWRAAFYPKGALIERLWKWWRK